VTGYEEWRLTIQGQKQMPLMQAIAQPTLKKTVEIPFDLKGAGLRAAPAAMVQMVPQTPAGGFRDPGVPVEPDMEVGLVEGLAAFIRQGVGQYQIRGEAVAMLHMQMQIQRPGHRRHGMVRQTLQIRHQSLESQIARFLEIEQAGQGARLAARQFDLGR